MTQLIPCPSCNRHVRQAEASCPFCGAALSLGHVPEHPLPRTRLGRAATFAFGATLVGATALTGCSGSEEGKEGKGGSAGMSGGGSSAGQASGGTGITPVYGAPAAGTGSDTGGKGSGGSAGTGGTVNDGGGAMALYGAVPAGGSEGTAGFTSHPLYGAAPAD